MNRRSVLLLLATLVAVIGTALVFLYVRSADKRATEQFDTVPVLQAVEVIEPGETVESILAGGKLKEEQVPQNQRLEGALTSTDSLKGLVATTTIYPGEQIIPGKFGGQAGAADALAIPDGMEAISVELSDSGRVAGFVNPGSEVAIYHVGPMIDVSAITAEDASRIQVPKGPPPNGNVVMLLKRVLVLGVGSTSTTTKTTVTTADGQATTQEVPKTLLTIAVSQDDAEKVIFADSEPNGNLAFALLNDKSVTRYTRGTGWGNLYYI